jgi:hypothetical protein
MQRQYAMPVEEVQQLGVGNIALITGGLGAWCQVYPLGIPDDLLRAALAYVSTPPRVSPPPSPPPAPEPAPPKKTSRPSSSPSDQSAQRQGHIKGRGKRESQVSRSSQVPTEAAVSKSVPVQSPPSTAASAPSISVETVRRNSQVAAPGTAVNADDSPVDF